LTFPSSIPFSETIQAQWECYMFLTFKRKLKSSGS
jgi:hypothetical protein